MKKCLGLLLTLFLFDSASSQETGQRPWEIGVGAGVISFVLNDQMLNYYDYKSTVFSPYNIHCYFMGEKNLHFFNFYYREKELPLTSKAGSYYFNFIQLYDARFSYEYYHRLKTFGTRTGLFLGTSLNLFSTSMNEHYKSLYWTFETGQNSYDFSQVVAVNAMLDYSLGKWRFMAKAAYGLLNIAARPDDYFVKYGERYKLPLKVYSLGSYRNIQFSVSCHYDISSRFSLQFEYLSEYRSYTGYYNFKFLKQSWLGGISFKF